MSLREEKESTHWRVHLLGGLKVTRGSESVAQFRTRKTASLLAYLAFHRPPTPRESLIDLFWPDVPLQDGRNNLRVLLSHLRARFETPSHTTSALSSAFLETNRFAVALHPLVTTDVEEFEAELRLASKTLNQDERIQAYERAASLYQGPLLGGFYESWIPLEAARLEAAYLRALSPLIHFYRNTGNETRAQEFEHLANRYNVTPTLPIASAPVQKQLRPVASAQEARSINQEAAATQSVSLPGQATPPLVTSFSPVLPVPLTRCFGREAEVVQLHQHLSENQTRLITLTGPGGVGKTRLALEAAHLFQANQRHAQRYDDSDSEATSPSEMPDYGVLWIPLADVTESDRLPEVLMAALQISASETNSHLPLERIVQSVQSQSASPHLLWLFDNMEQLLPGAARIIHQLLERIPHLRILATSRSCLNVSGELEVPVLPLSLPPNLETAGADELASAGEASSLQLLIDRTRLARSDWTFSARDIPTLTKLVHKLEGLPLAIELVAARSGILSPVQMLARLDVSWNWVSSRKAGIPARHRSLRAVFDWSIDLLSPLQRRVLAQSSVFRGGWTLEDAGAVIPDATSDQLLDVFQELRDASLAISREGETGQMRFSMLEVIRQHAVSLLSDDERNNIERRHAQHYFALAVQAARSNGYVENRGSHAKFEPSNFSAALDFWTQNDLERALQMANSLWWLWAYSSEFAEGRRRFRQLLANPQITKFPYARACTQNVAALLALSDNDTNEAEPFLRDALAYWQAYVAADTDPTPSDMASTLNLLGSLHMKRNEPSKAREFYQQHLLFCRQHQLRELPTSLNTLADAERGVGNANEVRRLCQEVLNMNLGNADRGAISWALYTLGWLALDENELTTAKVLQEQSLAMRREHHALPRVADCLNALGEIAIRQGELSEARRHFEEAITIWRALHRIHHVREAQHKLEALPS